MPNFEWTRKYICAGGSKPKLIEYGETPTVEPLQMYGRAKDAGVSEW